MSSEQLDPPTFSLDALRAGDRAEFARLVESYSGMIYRLAVKMLEDAQDAEDVLQETFIKAYRGLAAFDGRSSLSTWLYRIAANESLMALRRRKNAPASLDEAWDGQPEQEPQQIVDWRSLPEDELLSTEGRAYLDRAIDALPPSLRVVFLLRDIEGLSTQETGEALGLSTEAVKTRLSRARLRLREQLTSYYGVRSRGAAGQRQIFTIQGFAAPLPSQHSAEGENELWSTKPATNY
jgi:RNA polymerase sigma-70 factor, ECF subfamily